MIYLWSSPIENDWQIPHYKNNVLIDGNESSSKEKKFAIIISTENSNQLEERIGIQKPDNNGKVVQFYQSSAGKSV